MFRDISIVAVFREFCYDDLFINLYVCVNVFNVLKRRLLWLLFGFVNSNNIVISCNVFVSVIFAEECFAFDVVRCHKELHVHAVNKIIIVADVHRLV